jgi:TolB-like protein/DNA-binding winged helix-turn-helix (wHTH) protein/Flp pilus assembly protein TadD
MERGAWVTNREETIRFDDFEFDPRSGELLYKGTAVRIQPQPLRVLRILLERPGETISREELSNLIWGDTTYVEFDQGLNYCIRQIRVALGDSATKPVYVETLPRQGYRFLPTPVHSNWSGAELNSSPAEAVLESPPSQPTAAPSPVSFAPSNRRHIGWVIAAGLGACLAIAAGWLYLSPAPRITSLAVLPLDNLSGNPGEEYFADGVTDELTTMLAKSSTLRVVSRTSAMQYKGAHRSLSEIARALGVDGIIEGSVARSGNRVHMTIQLIDGRRDTHLWAESFDRDRNDSGSLAREVGQAVAKRLGSAVPSTAAPRFVRSDAHDAYLHGRYLWFTDHNEQSGKYFQKAAELQPDYALAWTGVADYYSVGAVEGLMRPTDSLPRAEAAARKAVSLDDSLAQAHLSFCAILFFADWDWPKALRECARAQDLDPELAEAWHMQAKILASLNRHPEALQAERKAMDLNPLARPFGMALQLNWARQYDAAIVEARARLESAPSDTVLLWCLESAYRAKGMEKDAIRTAESIMRASGNAALAAETAEAFRKGGYRAAVRAWLAFWRALSRRQYVAPLRMAVLTAQLRDREQTLALLEQGYEEHSPFLLEIQFDPAYDFLHADERYRSIIRKIGLPADF